MLRLLLLTVVGCSGVGDDQDACPNTDTGCSSWTRMTLVHTMEDGLYTVELTSGLRSFACWLQWPEEVRRSCSEEDSFYASDAGMEIELGDIWVDDEFHLAVARDGEVLVDVRDEWWSTVRDPECSACLWTSATVEF